MAEVDVNIDINVENNSSWELNQITNNVIHLHQAVQQEVKQESKWEASLKRIGRVAGTAARAVAKKAASVLALAAATGPAIIGLLGVARAVGVFGSSLANLTPLVAFVPSLIGSFLLVKKTVGLMGPGFSKAFEPIMANFRNAKGEASDFTKRLQNIAGIGLKPLVSEFNRVNMPAIKGAMESVAYHVQSVVAHTMHWLNTAQGQKLIKDTAVGISKAMASLFPHVIRLINAFGGLASKAGDRAITGLADVIGRVLDKISAWAETHDLDDINAALEDLGGYGGKLKDTFTVVRDIGRWMAENQGKVKAFSDAVAVGAIAIGIATGNIPAVVGGAFALIVNHWSELKAQFTGAKPWLSDLMTQWKTDANRIRLTEALMGALRGFRDAFLNVTKDIGPKFAAFVRELKAAWQEWAPLLTAWWNTGGKQMFQALGAAIGLIVLALLGMATQAAESARLIAAAFKASVHVVLDVLGSIIGGAAKAFSWVPGLGPKLQAAAAEFEAFKNSVNRALNGIEAVKTIRINASVYVTGGGNVAGGVDQRTGNSRNAGLSGLTSWQRVAAAFAGASESGSTSRTDGPASITAQVQNTILLDGRPFRDYTDHLVMERERRAAWRLKTGTR
jgi:hypothetical protein